MRKMKMGELLARHEGQSTKPNSPAKQPVAVLRSPSKQSVEDRPLPPVPSPAKMASPVRQQNLHPQKSRKRKSSAIQIPSDKENNEPDDSNAEPHDLAVQKNTKRAKTAANSAPVVPKRTASKVPKKPLKQTADTGGVLSPRSLNSQTLPRSPMKDKDLPIPAREASPLRQQQLPTRPLSPTKPVSPFKAATSALSAFAKRGYAAAGAAGARLTRPISREKDQPTLSGTGTTIPGSPVGKMLPPPRPALATLTSTSATSLPTLSPQRTTSQASMRSNTSEQSAASTAATVVTKPARALTTKKTAIVTRAPTRKITATTTASKARSKVVVSGSTVSTVTSSPRGPVKKIVSTSATAKKAASAATSKKSVAAPTTSGRVLRKRN